MNQKDRDYLARLYTCMTRWPWPNRTRTLGPKELSEFFACMDELQPLFTSAIMAIARQDDPQMRAEEELGDLEATLTRMNGE